MVAFLRERTFRRNRVQWEPIKFQGAGAARFPPGIAPILVLSPGVGPVNSRKAKRTTARLRIGLSVGFVLPSFRPRPFLLSQFTLFSHEVQIVASAPRVVCLYRLPSAKTWRRYVTSARRRRLSCAVYFHRQGSPCFGTIATHHPFSRGATHCRGAVAQVFGPHDLPNDPAPFRVAEGAAGSPASSSPNERPNRRLRLPTRPAPGPRVRRRAGPRWRTSRETAWIPPAAAP